MGLMRVWVVSYHGAVAGPVAGPTGRLFKASFMHTVLGPSPVQLGIPAEAHP